MDERTRQLVLDLLGKAHEGALAAVQSGIEPLESAEREAVLGSIEAVRSCLLRQLEGTVMPSEAEERITALIHGYQDQRPVRVMEGYARTLVDLLADSRSGLATVRRHRDH